METTDSSLSQIQETNHDKVAFPLFRDMAKAHDSELRLMGGKAATLAKLLKKGFPVPPGAVVFQEPSTTEDVNEIITWWKKQGSYPVAARSSASGEDSSDYSYAGQFLTLLHLSTPEGLTAAIKTCFQAVHREASRAYASHFERQEIPMHVLVQRMIESQFSGVYFSVDPRKGMNTENGDQKASWLVEVVEGQGEQLVSGQVTPFRFTPEHEFRELDPHELSPKKWKKEYLQQILKWGQEIENTLGYKVDMEWAIDQEGQFWILQSRPITTLEASTERTKILAQEWQRLLQNSPADSTWDGHTFAEWTGVPTEFTFDLWQKTFQQGQAFDLALKSIGYEGLGEVPPGESLLERVYGRAYLKLNSMESVYFGRSPYRLNPFPRPHLEFDWSKLNTSMILRAPHGLGQMAHVAWSIQTGRSELAKKALQLLKPSEVCEYQGAPTLNTLEILKRCFNLNFQEQKDHLKKLCDSFTEDSLQATFLITLLIEATTQGLMALLEKDLGEKRSAEALHLLTGQGLETVARQMQQELSKVDNDPNKWQEFLNHFGHRGMGELELSHPRWVETQQPQSKRVFKPQLNLEFIETSDLEKNSALGTFMLELSSLRRPVFKQEWTELQKLMQIREEIKMELMKPYAQIRWLLLGIAQHVNLDADIFWLRLDEVLNLKTPENMTPAERTSLRKLATDRKQKAQYLKSVDLPMFFSLQELKAVIDNNSTAANSAIIRGVCLSPGIASGVVHIVTDPETEDLESWPEECVLIAEATDPGWTPLFERAKAVVVARGGVLSHCAIVAREMGLPAVGEICGASHLFKEGERVWVDGNHGTVRRTD